MIANLLEFRACGWRQVWQRNLGYAAPVRSRLPALLLLCPPLVSGVAPEALASEAEGRFPIWPTEIDRIAAPLRDPTMMSESARIAALAELSEYATEVILGDLEFALTDPSPEVRSQALQLCAERRLLACVDEAEKMWEEGEGSVRLMALKLLSQDPTQEHLDLIYEAMRDPNDVIRQQAILLLVDAPLGAERAAEARQELVAQLGDFSALVRRTAAQGLGRMGPGEGALALVRLLEDIDPSVSSAAAVSLGQIADTRTSPALRRALENPNNGQFAIAALGALARLPGQDIDAALLELLDAPPRNLGRPDVARAIGRRPEATAELIGGLVDRMRDPELREPSTQALLLLGDRAVALLENAAERGLEPDIALEVERLLAARRLEPTPRIADNSQTVQPTLVLPALDQREAWFELLGDPEAVPVGAALAEQLGSPGMSDDGADWFEGALAWQLDRAATAEQVSPWLTALALAPHPVLDAEAHAVSWARIAGWAHASGASAQSRCLATLALGRAVETRHAEAMREELRTLAAAHVVDVRGCAALALARHGDDPLLESLLADPSPRVRAAAALALRVVRKPAAAVRSRLALQADRDSEPRARTSAALVLESRDPSARFVLLRGRANTTGLSDTGQWERYEWQGHEVDVPMLGSDRGWAIVPLAGAVEAMVDTAPVLIPTPSYPGGGYY
jgi:HEAT repeat protein